ncbi:PilZ domain-containing protein [Microvirga sp. BT688]|uniref:PilZ domain-containing protein n=1 Tax=Microvirga sp. TaxID=1873136 RepID=UPI001685B94B|nr:PilZ domain-containing protein [Microvirga sp.]
MSDGSDQRWHHRRPTTITAKVLAGSGSPPLTCTVQNLSAGGAQLTFPEELVLPATFMLEVPSLNLQVDAQVIWSQGHQHGVTFVWPQHKERGGRPSA